MQNRGLGGETLGAALTLLPSSVLFFIFLFIFLGQLLPAAALSKPIGNELPEQIKALSVGVRRDGWARFANGVFLQSSCSVALQMKRRTWQNVYIYINVRNIVDLSNPLKCILRIISLWIYRCPLKMHSTTSQGDLHIRCEISLAFCLRSRLSLPFPRLHWASNADASLWVIACSCQNNKTLEAVRTRIFRLYFAAFSEDFFYFFMLTLNLAWVCCQGCDGSQTNLISFWCVRL